MRSQRFIRRRPNRYYPQAVLEYLGDNSNVKLLSREEFPPGREVGMEDAVWKQGLPEDVFCTILARLPLSSLCRLRCVCKTWNAMTGDRGFLEAYSRVPSQDPSLVFVDKDGGSYYTYEPATRNWWSIPLSFFVPHDSCSLIAAAAGRLLLLRHSKGAQQSSLLLLNPLNKSHRLLPPMMDMQDSEAPSGSDIHIVGLFMDSEAKYYNILVVDKRSNAIPEDEVDDGDADGSSLEPISSQVYDSRTDSWELKGSFGPEYELSIVNAALYDETLHCLTCASEVPRANSFYDQLAIYSVLPYDWEEDPVNMPVEGQSLVSPHLFACRGKQMLVAALPSKDSWVEKKNPPQWSNVIVWELEALPELGSVWKKVMEIEPRELEEELWNIGLTKFVFLTEGDCIYFGSSSGSTLAMINLRSLSWRLLPMFPGYTPYDGRSDSDFNFQRFLYEPRFDLVV